MEQSPVLRAKPQPGNRLLSPAAIERIQAAVETLKRCQKLRWMVDDVRRRVAEGQEGTVLYTLHLHRGGVSRIGVAEVKTVDVDVAA